MLCYRGSYLLEVGVMTLGLVLVIGSGSPATTRAFLYWKWGS